ncbi:hypothetical protein DPMN_032686 [Dreissena polymorpha]|uniref:Uncharacterized protein n=1 Tax=Dreissena polymorpha TaxID=45954 RepID=A0A9D4M5I5_DREPO|nr:hypothetical protein DPMN_032686 [Dreissena polymorpha]
MELPTRRLCADPGFSRDDDSEINNTSVTGYYEGPEVPDGDIADSDDHSYCAFYFQGRRGSSRAGQRGIGIPLH